MCLCVNVCVWGSRAHCILTGLADFYSCLCAGLFIASPHQWTQEKLGYLYSLQIRCVCVFVDTFRRLPPQNTIKVFPLNSLGVILQSFPRIPYYFARIWTQPRCSVCTRVFTLTGSSFVALSHWRHRASSSRMEAYWNSTRDICIHFGRALISPSTLPKLLPLWLSGKKKHLLGRHPPP